MISFGDLISRAKGMSINAEKSLLKYQYNVIGIMPKQNLGFQSSMLEMQRQIQPILEQFEQIVGYGGSMGGYAAIKYSNLLNMHKIVAFVPQYSIDPDVVHDRRYAEFLMHLFIKICRFRRMRWIHLVNTSLFMIHTMQKIKNIS